MSAAPEPGPAVVAGLFHSAPCAVGAHVECHGDELFTHGGACLCDCPCHRRPPMPLPGSWVQNWFSNMLECDEPFEYQGVSFRTVENFYQAMKTATDDTKTRRRIAGMRPHAAKKFAKSLAVRPDWPGLRLRVMEYGLRRKWGPGTTWNARLLATGDDEIVEYNNWRDTYWGWDLTLMRGENHLGRLLMRLRKEYREADT